MKTKVWVLIHLYEGVLDKVTVFDDYRIANNKAEQLVATTNPNDSEIYLEGCEIQ